MFTSFVDDPIRFIVLLTPGILALWVYKPFLLRSTSEDSWEKDIFIAVMLGLPGYLVITSFCAVARLPIGAQFVISVIISVAIAVIAGKMHRNGIHPLHAFAKRDSQKRRYQEDVPYGRGLSYIMDKAIQESGLRDGHTSVALIYNIGAKRDDALIGEIVFYDVRYNDIVVDARPEISLKQIDQNHWDINPWLRNVNLDTGIVVEIANVENTTIKKIHDYYDDLKAEEYKRGI